MLDELKKGFNKVFGTTTNEEVNMEEVVTQPDMSALNETADLSAQLATQASAFSELQAKFAELSAKYETAQASLAALEVAKEDLVAKAAKDKLAAREKSLVDAIGTLKAKEMLSTLSVLDDASFDAVVSTMKVNLDAEAKSELFTEKGVTAEAATVVQPTHFKNFIKGNK